MRGDTGKRSLDAGRQKPNWEPLRAVTTLTKSDTCKDDPTTKRESASLIRLCTKSTLSGFTVSPKKTTSGFRGPPHRVQDGTRKLCTCSSVRKTSPSGATPWASALQVGFRISKRSCSTPREVCSPQSKQRTLKPKRRLTAQSVLGKNEAVKAISSPAIFSPSIMASFS